MSQKKIKIKNVDIKGRTGYGALLDENDVWWQGGNQSVKRKMSMMLKGCDMILTVDLNNLIADMEVINSQETLDQVEVIKEKAEEIIIPVDDTVYLKVVSGKEIKINTLEPLFAALKEIGYTALFDKGEGIVFKKLR